MSELKLERMTFLMEAEWEAVCDALWDAFYEPTQDKVRRVVDFALANPTVKEVWVARCIGMVGVLVCDISQEPVVVDYVGTARVARSQGTARGLIHRLREVHTGRRIEAETDDSAVEFYRRCGFEADLLPQKYPGVNRWRVHRAS